MLYENATGVITQKSLAVCELSATSRPYNGNLITRPSGLMVAADLDSSGVDRPDRYLVAYNLKAPSSASPSATVQATNAFGTFDVTLDSTPDLLLAPTAWSRQQDFDLLDSLDLLAR